jgi:hypothetical protein
MKTILKSGQSNENPGGGDHPGVDVMITIFNDFPQFSEKIGVFIEKQFYFPFLD